MQFLTLIFAQLFALSLAAGELFYGDLKANHGPISEGHVQTAEDFIKKHLKNEAGHYDFIKARSFKQRLLQEREYFLNDLYETQIIEEIELQLSKEDKALEEAREVLERKKNGFLIAFDDYLLPRLDILIEQASSSPECSKVCDGIVDEFLTVYSSFYSPNRYRNYNQQDFNFFNHVRHRKGHFVPKNDPEIPEASNLVAPKSLLSAVRGCLRDNVSEETFLNQSQLKRLKECGFDLSLLNPGKSPLWKKTNRHGPDDSMFPKEGQPVYFKSVKMSGRGSAKIKAYYIRNGQKKKVKLKISGLEPHSEPMTAKLATMLGFHQDPVVYRPSTTVIMEDMDDYREFQSFIYKKYGERTRNRLFKVEDYGEGKILTFRHVSIEGYYDNLIKLGSPDVFGWDHKNRREYRAFLLWLGFVNLSDIKNNNWRIQLRETQEGLQPEVSLQDVGYAMSRSHTWDKPHEFMTLRTKTRNINNFADSAFEDTGEMIRVKWADIVSYPNSFETTAYSDLKWMARQILELSREDFKKAIKASGLSVIEQKIYLLKLGSRRDELTRVFNLEKEYPPFDLGDYRDINIDGKVKNGLVIAPQLEGSAYDQTSTPTLLTIGNFIQNSFKLDVFNKKVQASIGSQLGGEVEIDLPFHLIKDESFGFYLGRPGVDVGFSRKIEDAGQMQYSQNTQKFYCVDSYTFTLNAQAGIMSQLSQRLPVEAKAKVSLFKFTFNHYRPFETAGEALKAEPTLIASLSNLNNYILGLKRNEHLTYSSETELKFEIQAGQGQDFRVKAGREKIKTKPITFSKNEFGEFKVFKEKSNTRRTYVEASVGKQISFFYIPLIGAEFSFEKFDARSELYHFPLPERSLDDAIAQDYRATDLRILRDLINGNFSNPLIQNKRKYILETDGSIWSKSGFFRLLFKANKSEMYAKTQVNYEGNQKKTFYRHVTKKRDQTGISNRYYAGLLINQNKSEVEVQLEEDDPENFVVILNNFNYKKNRTKYGLEVFIDELNELYSNEESFFTKDALPPADEVDHYKKVLSHVRVFLFGKGLLKKLDKLWDHELRSIVRNGVMERSSLLGEANAYKLYRKLQWIRTMFRMESLDKKTIVKQLGKAVYGLKTHKNGLQILKNLFGEKHMFVMGEIYGVLPSYSYSQQQNTVADRRFAGKSWGKYKERPPFWKFLKDFPIMARPKYAPLPLDNEYFMPTLPTGEPDIH